MMIDSVYQSAPAWSFGECALRKGPVYGRESTLTEKKCMLVLLEGPRLRFPRPQKNTRDGATGSMRDVQVII